MSLASQLFGPSPYDWVDPTNPHVPHDLPGCELWPLKGELQDEEAPPLAVVPDLAKFALLPLVFICAPLRSPYLGGRMLNMARARQLMLESQHAGMATICVHTMCEGTQNEIDEALLMDYDLRMIKACDGMILGEGWDESEGCLREVAFAKSISVPTFFSVHHARRALLG